MGEISLNPADSLKVLNSPDADPNSRVIAACAMAMFEASDHADDIEPSTRAIALKLSHMVAAAIYDAQE